MLNSKLEKQIEELTHKYMSYEGKCETVAGEILRAYNQMLYRYYNDCDDWTVVEFTDNANNVHLYSLLPSEIDDYEDEYED